MEKLKLERKKGDVTDILVFLILVTIVGIGLFILSFTTTSISDGLRQAGINSTNNTADAIDSLEDFGKVQIERGFFLVFIGLIISSFISAFLVRSHPIFIFMYIFFYGLTIFLGTYLANVYDQMRQIPIFADTFVSQNLINLIFENLIPIIVAVGAISMIIVFAKFSSNGIGGDKLG